MKKREQSTPYIILLELEIGVIFINLQRKTMK